MTDRSHIKSVHKLVKLSTSRLRQSERTMEDIYRIIFDREGVLAETSRGGEICRHTYEEAKATIDRLAAAIAATMGSDNRFIALYCENRVEWIYLFWAILKSGNKPYLVNLQQPVSLTRSVMNTLQVERVIAYETCSDLSKPITTYAELLSTAAVLSPSCAFGDAVALTTSGTTLNEKICIYTGKEIAAQVLNAEQAIAWNADIKATYNGQLKHLAFLPFYHIFGLEAVYLWFCFFGAIFVFPESIAPETLLRTVRQHSVTHIFAVPLLWHAVEKLVRRELAQKPEKTQKAFENAVGLSLKLQNLSPRLGRLAASKLLSEVRGKLFGDSVQFCISGGSPLKASAMELINGIGYPLYSGYGMTEVGIACADFEPKPKYRLDPSIGVPFSSVDFAVDDDGVLSIRGESVCKQMLVNGQPLLNDGWFSTGDIVEKDAHGKYRILGRLSDVVMNEAGENLNPDLAEEVFALSQAKAFTVTGDARNEQLVLIVQVPSLLSEAQKTTLQQEIEQGLAALPPSYRIKEVFYTVDALMGDKDIKISRAKVRRAIERGELHLVSALDEPATETTGEDSAVKRELREMIAFLLGVDVSEVRDEAHFLNDLGATSLDYFSLIGEVNERYGITLDFEGDNFGYDLNGLAQKVEALIRI